VSFSFFLELFYFKSFVLISGSKMMDDQVFEKKRMDKDA